MAKITFTLEDVVSGMTSQVALRVVGLTDQPPETYPATEAMLFAATIKRLWDSGSLAHLAGLVVSDLITTQAPIDELNDQE